MRKAQTRIRPRTEVELPEVVKRLDAIVALLIKLNTRGESSPAMTNPEAARLLHKLGFTPTEIAKALGLKSRTSLGYLYRK